MSDPTIRISKFLSLVLRHKPEAVGVELDPNGWVAVDALLQSAAARGTVISRELLDEIVFTNDKQRFAFSDDGTKIRANQGHSVAVDLGLEPVEPPDRLFHGTATRFLPSVEAEGIDRRTRRHVHLSGSPEQARRVGARHGRPVVLAVQSGRMHAEGTPFYRSENGVWLTDRVPVGYFEVFEPNA